MADIYVTRFFSGSTTVTPAFYVDKDMEPSELRLHTNVAPDSADMEVDILDDGVSILDGAGLLTKGETQTEDAGDFASTIIEEGSWLVFNITPNGAKDITLQLELNNVSE